MKRMGRCVYCVQCVCSHLCPHKTGNDFFMLQKNASPFSGPPGHRARESKILNIFATSSWLAEKILRQLLSVEAERRRIKETFLTIKTNLAVYLLTLQIKTFFIFAAFQYSLQSIFLKFMHKKEV